MTPIPATGDRGHGDSAGWHSVFSILSTGTEKISHANINQKQAEEALLISDEENFRRKELSQDRRDIASSQKTQPTKKT